MKSTAETDMETMQRRHQNLLKLCKEQSNQIELLQAQLKHKEQILEASDATIKDIIRSYQEGY